MGEKLKKIVSIRLRHFLYLKNADQKWAEMIKNEIPHHETEELRQVSRCEYECFMKDSWMTIHV